MMIYANATYYFVFDKQTPLYICCNLFTLRDLRNFQLAAVVFRFDVLNRRYFLCGVT